MNAQPGSVVYINGVRHIIDARGVAVAAAGKEVLAKRFYDSESEMTAGMRQSVASGLGAES